MINGETIRLVRNWKKMKQKTVADKLGISQPAYSKIEKSKQINKKRLEKLLSIFSCSDKELKILLRIMHESE